MGAGRVAIPVVLGLAMLAGAPFVRRSVAAPPPSKVDTLTLENGLAVVLRRTPGAADGAVVVVYAIGGEHDPVGRSGLAHVIERLYLLAGTEITPVRDRDDVRMRPPARGVSHGLGYDHVAADDHTMFARVLPSKDIASEVEDAADRMTGLRVREQELAAARSHVRTEISNAAGANPATAAPELARAAIVEPRLRGRRLGRSEDVAAITLEEVKARLDKLYRPRNAVLAISGDFDLGIVRALVKKRFGPIVAGEPVGPPVEHPETPLPRELAAAGSGPVTLERAVRGEGRAVCAAICLSAPKREPTKEYAAFLVLAARLRDLQQAPPPTGAPGLVFTFTFDPWRDPKGFLLTRAVPTVAGALEAVASLESTLETAALMRYGMVDAARTRSLMNLWFGVPPTEGSFADQPLLVAYGDARRATLDIDGDAILKRLGDIRTEDVRAVAARAQRTVVVVPK